MQAAWIGSTVLGVLIGTTSIAWVGLLVGVLLCVGGSIAASQLAEHNLTDDVDDMWRNSSKEWALFMFPIEVQCHSIVKFRISRIFYEMSKASELTERNVMSNTSIRWFCIAFVASCCHC